MYKKTSLVLLLFAMFLWGEMGLAGAQANYTPTFEYTDCWFYIAAESGEVEGDTVECGWLTVPEVRAQPTSGNIQLAVAVIYSTNPNPASDPVVYLEGGPGGSAIAGINFWYRSSLRQSRDIILIEQRGTGYSLPTLNCDELDDTGEVDSSVACRASLIGNGINIAAYNSYENAHDVADLLVALDIPQANLFGVSYGTRLALTVLRERPERIRSVIIDAVFPPHVNGYDEQAVNAYGAFSTLFANCAADAACNRAYPDLENVFYRTVDMLNASPALVTDEETGEPVEYTGDDMVNDLFQMMYDASAVPTLPAMIYDFSVGIFDNDYDTGAVEDEEGINPDDLTEDEIDRLLMEYLGYDDIDAYYDYIDSLNDDEYDDLINEAIGGIDDDSEGMFATVECQEEVPFNSIAAAEALSVGVPPQIAEPMLIGVEEQIADCEIWDVPPSGAIENEPVRSDVPVLVFSGEYDPITPPAWGQAAADYLPNSNHFTFPGIGHGALDTHPCPTSIALTFLDAPGNVASLDGSCIAGMSTNFYIED